MICLLEFVHVISVVIVCFRFGWFEVEEIRDMVDNDLGFQQVESKVPSQTKTFLFISNDKKVTGCLIAEHIQEVSAF